MNLKSECLKLQVLLQMNIWYKNTVKMHLIANKIAYAVQIYSLSWKNAFDAAQKETIIQSLIGCWHQKDSVEYLLTVSLRQMDDKRLGGVFYLFNASSDKKRFPKIQHFSPFCNAESVEHVSLTS